jgi:hypothetical protein
MKVEIELHPFSKLFWIMSSASYFVRLYPREKQPSVKRSQNLGSRFKWMISYMLHLLLPSVNYLFTSWLGIVAISQNLDNIINLMVTFIVPPPLPSEEKYLYQLIKYLSKGHIISTLNLDERAISCLISLFLCASRLVMVWSSKTVVRKRFRAVLFAVVEPRVWLPACNLIWGRYPWTHARALRRTGPGDGSSYMSDDKIDIGQASVEAAVTCQLRSAKWRDKSTNDPYYTMLCWALSEPIHKKDLFQKEREKSRQLRKTTAAFYVDFVLQSYSSSSLFNLHRNGKVKVAYFLYLGIR